MSSAQSSFTKRKGSAHLKATRQAFSFRDNEERPGCWAANNTVTLSWKDEILFGTLTPRDA